MPSPSEVVCVFGRRGAGKTTAARRLAGQARRVLVYDPLGEWATFRGYVRASSIRQAGRLLAAGQRVAYLPPAAHKLHAGHCLARLAWDMQSGARSPLTLILDEAQLAYPVSALPADFWGLPTVLLQGRHRKIGLIAISQRPALLSLDLRAMAHRSLWFGVAGQDQQAARKTLPAAAAQRLASLPDHHFLLEERGQVTPGQNPSRR